MGQYILLSLFTIFLIGTANIAGGVELFQSSNSVRALGMGNAYASVVSDANSIFYNPAGLAQVRGVNWTILDLSMRANGIETFKEIWNFKDSRAISDTVRKLYGKRIWASGGGKSAITLPYFAFAIYDQLNVNLSVNNPVYPNADTAIINDQGYAIGVGLPIFPMLHVGMAVHRITRTGDRVSFGPSLIENLDLDAFLKNIKKKGVGYAADIGMNIKFPGPVSPTLSLVWRNAVQTKFKADRGSEAPPFLDEDDLAVGVALDIDSGWASITPVLEVKYLNLKDEQLAKKIHLGVEMGLPLVDIRAGFYQGYYTLGAGLSFGPLRFDAATYAVEIGEYAGQLEDRRYVAQLTVELGFDMDLRFLGGGDGGRSGSRARRRLKQRR